MASLKGKEKMIETNSFKRKKTGDDDEKMGHRKRRNRAVLQLFDDAAYEVNADSSSDDQDDFDINDFLEDEVLNDVEANNHPVKVPLVPFIKEEEMDNAELERMVEERYGRGSSFIRYAEDGYDDREAVDPHEHLPDFRDPTLWKVKCMAGRERHSVYCLMQKYVDLQTLGTKLLIISAFSLDHVKGFIYIEAHSQQDLYEVCKGLSNVYVSRVTTVPPDQRAHVLLVQSKGCAITAGMWARVKRGKYKGDLARIVAVNEARKKATVKLIPRIDLRVLAEKIGGGVPVKRAYTAIPPRLISSTELEEFRPLIQNRRDRDTEIIFEVLNGMMLKDGYLYKKIAIDSLSVWGAMPTEDELLKFEPPNNNESMDLEFLSDLYGNANVKKKQILKNDKGVEKGEAFSTSNMEYNFEVHDLVFFGKKDFGVIIGMEKDDHLEIMTSGTEGPLILTLPAKDLKSASFDKKLFYAKDGHMKKISINDRVRVMDGLLKDKEGVVKHIYGGIIFLCNEREEYHNGYICFKSQICEKVICAGEASHEQGNEPGPSGLGKSPSSPKTPLSTDKAWMGRGNSSFNQEDKNAMFSVGQSLRIRVGPLKGYLCRVLAIRLSNITVKLDSQNKILTVKSVHLSEVRKRSSASVTGGDQESAEPLDIFAKTDVSRDWANGSTESRGRNVGGASTKGTSWPSFPASGIKLQSESGAVTDTIGGDFGWAAADTKQVNCWGKQQVSSSTFVAASGAANSWGQASWGQKPDAKLKESRDQAYKNQSWGNQDGGSSSNKYGQSSWSNPTVTTWGRQADDKTEEVHGRTEQKQSWGNQAGSSLNKPDSGSGLSKPTGGSSWEKQVNDKADKSHGITDQNPSWGSQGGSSWKKRDGGPAWCKLAGGSSRSQQADANTNERNNSNDQQPSWGKHEGGSWNKQDGGSSWGKPPGGFSWGKQSDANAKARNAESVRGAEGGNNWSETKPSDGSASGWQMNSKSFNKTQFSGWGNSSSWNQSGAGNSIDSEKRDQNDSWVVKTNSVGGSSTGWGKGNWGKSSTDDPPENQNSSWSSKSDWGAGNDYSRIHEQVENISRGGGRGGSWRGGRGGRGESDRGGFGGRAGSARGGFRGRGGSFGGREGSERGGYGGRGRSDRGGFGGRGRGRSDRGGLGGRGRGRSDRGGFRGRGRSDQGGFGGRGRGRSDQYGGDWNTRNDSGEEKTTSWSKSRTADGGTSNENKGNWNQGGAHGGQQKGWRSGSQSKGNNDGADGGGGQGKSWNSGGSWSKNRNNGGWNQGSSSGC